MAMIAAALVLAAMSLPGGLPQGKPPKSIYEAGLSRPTGRNGYEEYLRAGKLVATDAYKAYAKWMVSLQGDDNRPTPPPPGMKADATLLDARDGLRSRFGKALELIREGNAKPVIDPSAGADFDTFFDHLADFKSITRLGTDVAHSDFAHGRTASANDTLLELLQFSNATSGGNLISFLVGAACEAIVTAVYARHLDRLSVSDLAKIERFVERRLSERPMFLSAMENEANGILRMTEKAFSRPRSEVVDLVGAIGEPPLADRVGKLGSADIRRLGVIVRSRLEAAFRRKLQSLSASEANWTAQPEEPEPEPGEGIDAIAEQFLWAVIPVDAGAASAAAIRRTQLRLLRLHALVLRFRWDHDRLPTTLAEAVSKEDLIDPITGQPFQYEVRDGAYRLYGKGWGTTGEIELRYRRPPVAPGSDRIPSP